MNEMKSIPVYVLGGIPDLPVWGEEKLEFLVDLDSEPYCRLQETKVKADNLLNDLEECSTNIENMINAFQIFRPDQIEYVEGKTNQTECSLRSFAEEIKAVKDAMAVADSIEKKVFAQMWESIYTAFSSAFDIGLTKIKHVHQVLEKSRINQIDKQELVRIVLNDLNQIVYAIKMMKDPIRNSVKALDEEAHIISIVGDIHPAGQISFDSKTKIFKYLPDKNDKAPFNVTFSAFKNGERINQTIVITPFPSMPSERDYIISRTTAPDPSSSLYIQTSIKDMGKEGEYHLVSGMKIEIEKGHKNNLWDTYCKEKKQPGQSWEKRVRRLTICADQLIIRGTMSMPESDVNIFARELIFEDKGNNLGSIDTSPINYSLPAKNAVKSTRTKGQNGLHAQSAGNVSIYADKIVVPTIQEKKRILIHGGDGQDAGEGIDGDDGKSVYNWFQNFVLSLNDSDIHKKTFTWDSSSFDVPAVYFHWHFYWAASTVEKDSHGSPTFPTNGEDALAPGKPGNAGNGGIIKTNLPEAYQKYVDNSGGHSGKQANAVRGGYPGYPCRSSMYYAEGCLNLVTGWKLEKFTKENMADPDHPGTKVIIKETNAGKSFDSPIAEKQQGDCPAPIISVCANAWVHPFLLKTVLRFVRDAFLSGPKNEFENILRKYNVALQMEQPVGIDWGIEFSPSEYIAARTEVIALLHRIDSNLDYFGNPAGWSPLLTLPAWLQLYENDIDKELQTLILVDWVDQKAAETQDAADVLDRIIEDLNADTNKAVEEIKSAENALTELNKEISSVENDLWNFQKDLKALVEQLRAKAEVTLSQKALINFGVKTFSAVLSVIPYGQPGLSTIGSLANVMADYSSDDPYKTTGGIFDVLGNYTKGKLDDKAADIIAEAKKSEDDSTKKAESSKVKDAKETADKLTYVGKNIGSSLNQINEGLKGLRVPQSEVDAELSRLESQTPEFGDLVTKIKAVNIRKYNLTSKMDQALQILNGGYSRIISNLLAENSFDQQRGRKLGLIDHDAQLYVREMGQRARDTLAKYLYCLVKAYESTIFKPMKLVNYQLTDIFHKISKLLKDRKDLAINELANFSKAIRPLLEDNLTRVEADLLDEYQVESAFSFEIGLSTEQTPEIMEQLNNTGEAIFNLFDNDNLYLNDFEKIKLAKIEIRPGSWLFTEEPKLKTGTMMLTIEPSEDGTLRSGDNLFVMRSPERIGGEGNVNAKSKQIWGATYHFSDKKTDPIVPSAESLDLLAHLLHKVDNKTKEKLAKFPAMLNLKLKYQRLAQGVPNLSALNLMVTINATPTDKSYCLLEVRTRNHKYPIIRCIPADGNKRSDGRGIFSRFYPKGTAVTLIAPKNSDGKYFSHWDIINADILKSEKESNPEIKIRLNNNTRVFCNYGKEETLRTREISINVPEELRGSALAAIESNKISKVAKILRPNIMMSKIAMPCLYPLRNAPSLKNSIIVGIIDQGDKYRILEGPTKKEGQKWYKVNHKTSIGWTILPMDNF